ncbi:putative ribosomal RNA large subunit methyltransferase YwbD [Diplonema papillatum]|nr:putative ribosomal RNA large subunit methyltransferase YwbD [Diplonema papillatum]
MYTCRHHVLHFAAGSGRRWGSNVKKQQALNELVDGKETTRAPTQEKVGSHKRARAAALRQREARPKTMIERYAERAALDDLGKDEAPEDRYKAVDAKQPMPHNMLLAEWSTGVLLDPLGEQKPAGIVNIMSSSQRLPNFIRSKFVPDLAKLAKKTPIVSAVSLLPTDWWSQSANLLENRTQPKLLTAVGQPSCKEAPLLLTAGDDRDGATKTVENTIENISSRQSEAMNRRGNRSRMPGSIWQVYDSNTKSTAWAVQHWSGAHLRDIAMTVINWKGNSPMPNEAYWRAKILEAFELRALLLNFSTTNAYRMVNGLGDGVPGLIVDIVGAVAVVSTDDPPRECYRALRGVLEQMEIQHVLVQDVQNKLFVEKADKLIPAAPRNAHIILPSGHWTKGGVNSSTFLENGVPYTWSPDLAQNSFCGHYLRHRTARQLLAAVSKDKRVLDMFAYTGSMGISAMLGGASQVVFVETDPDYCAGIARNLSLHRPREEWGKFCRIETADALAYKPTRRFDIVICDPPDVTVLNDDDEVAADQFRFFSHALTNAVKFTAKGGKIFFLASTRLIHVHTYAKMLTEAAGNTGLQLTLVRTISPPVDFPQNASMNPSRSVGFVLQMA